MYFPRLPETETKIYDEIRASIMAEAPQAVKESLLEQGAPAGQDPETEQYRLRLQEVDYEEAQAALKNSIAGRIGSALTPISSVNGFDWRVNVALFSGVAAKEIIISTMGTAYSLGWTRRGEKIPLSGRLAADPSWTRLKAFSLIIFIMLYAPCFATIACIIRESSWKWGLFSMTFNTLTAFIISALVYRGGIWLGLG
jgi:ferrous iron transport protein B